MALRIEELTAATAAEANRLMLKPGQEAFVVPATYSSVEQQLDPAGSWPRVVVDEGHVVGYIMGAFDSDARDEYLRAALWRIVIAGEAQGRGVGRFAVQAFAEEARSRGFQRVTVVWADGPGSPGGFFTSVGFRVVGQTPFGENLGALDL